MPFRLTARLITVACLGVALAAPATPLEAETMLTPHTAEYRVKISVLGGKLRTSLQETDSGYVAEHVIRPSGLSKILVSGHISESSEFGTAADGIRPIHYASEDTISRDKTRASIRFDWETLRAHGTVDDEDVEFMLEDITHDRVSIQYELMHDLLNGTTRDSYVLFDVDELKTIEVRSIGSREVRVPAGRYEAVGIQHQRADSSRVTTLWCVPELDYLPVMIEQHRDGKLRVRAVLTRYTPTAT